MSPLAIIFLIIFVIYGAGWIWQTINDILRDAHRGQWEVLPGDGPRAARVLLDGHDVGELTRVFQQFAEQQRGELQQRQPFQAPKVSFLHHGARALLSLYEAGESGAGIHTQLTYTVPEGWPYRLEIAPPPSATERGLGPGDLQIGDSEFDARYAVKSNDAKFAREFLEPAARELLEDLRRLRDSGPVLVSLNSSRLLVRKRGVLGAAADLARFADLAGRLQERIEVVWQRASGIEILDDPAGPSSAPPVCPICGSAIPTEFRVDCRRCSTPHHRDCWDFNGQCATYACGEKRFAPKQ